MVSYEITEKELYQIASNFYLAIIKTRNKNKFAARDRMKYFPTGCCDDSCDLFSFYLKEVYGIITKQYNGTYRDGNPFNTRNHNWLETNNIIIDLTAIQFTNSNINTETPFYVGPTNQFYESFEDVRVVSNVYVPHNDRLFEDYKNILSQIEN